MSNQDSHEIPHPERRDRYLSSTSSSSPPPSSSTLPPLAVTTPSVVASEHEVALALASFHHSVDRLRHAGDELERFRIQLKQLLLASALLGDDLKYRPPPEGVLWSETSDKCGNPSRIRSSSRPERLRRAMEEVESTTTWSLDFGDETVDDVLRRRVLGVRARVAELEATAAPCIYTRAQLKAEYDQLLSKQHKSTTRRISILPLTKEPYENQSAVAELLADKLALATQTLLQVLRSLDEAERKRADDDAELVRATLEHFFRAGLRALQAPRRVSVSAYCDTDTVSDQATSLKTTDISNEDTIHSTDNNGNEEDEIVDGDRRSKETAPHPAQPPRSVVDFRPSRKQVRYQYPSSKAPSSSASTLKLPTMDELIAFTSKRLQWTRR